MKLLLVFTAWLLQSTLQTQAAELALPMPTLQADATKLSRRSEWKNIEASLRPKSSGEVKFTWLARIQPPVLNGRVLRPTDAFVSNNHIWLSYASTGTRHQGAVTQLSIEDIKTRVPVMSEYVFDHAAIQSVERRRSHVFAAASVAKSRVPGPAAYFSLSLKDGKPSPEAKAFALSGEEGLAVRSTVNYLHAASGGPGHLLTSTPELHMDIGQAAYRDIATVDSGPDHTTVLILANSPPRMESVEASSGRLLQTFPLPANSRIEQSPSALVVGQTMSAVALGPEGMQLRCNRSGSLVARAPAPDKGTISSVAAHSALLIGATGRATAEIYLMELANTASKRAASAEATSGCEPVRLRKLGELSTSGRETINRVVARSDFLILMSSQGPTDILYIDKTVPRGALADFDIY